MQLSINAVRALIEHHAENDVRMPLRLLVHFPNLLGVDTGRFFDHYMNPTFHTGNCVTWVIVVRNADNTGIDTSFFMFFIVSSPFSFC